jgi:transcriptional regulator with GAF, ATPase, and Fis domain
VTIDIGRRDTWVVALRGPSKPFNTANESQLNAILPFIVKSMAGFATNEQQSNFNTQLSELLDTATFLTSSLSPAVLYTKIREQVQKMLQCEKIVLYTIDQHQENLILHPENVLDAPRFPINRGITASIISTRSLVNVHEPCAHEKFDLEIHSVRGIFLRLI